MIKKINLENSIKEFKKILIFGSILLGNLEIWKKKIIKYWNQIK